MSPLYRQGTEVQSDLLSLTGSLWWAKVCLILPYLSGSHLYVQVSLKKIDVDTNVSDMLFLVQVIFMNVANCSTAVICCGLPNKSS